jgi:hypothetical protein
MALSFIARHARIVQQLFHAEDGRRFWAYPRRLLAVLTERPPEAARRAIVAMELGYNPDLVIRGRWDSLPAGAESRVAAALQELLGVESNGWLRFVDAPVLTLEMLADHVEWFRPHILWLDYIQRLRPSGRENRFEAVGEAVHALQRLAQAADVMVIVASQLKRRGDGVRDKFLPPHLEDFKLSGEIEELADVALGLFRPTRRLTREEERAVRFGERGMDEFAIPEAMALKVVKHRYWGESADRIVRLRVRSTGVTDWEPPPVPANAGDAWEEDRVPF